MIHIQTTLLSMTLTQQIALHQNTMNTILASQTTMLENLHADTQDIKTSINHIIHSISKIATKLGFQITLPPPLTLSPIPPPLHTIASSFTTTIMSSTTVAFPLSKFPISLLSINSPPIIAMAAPPPPASTTVELDSTMASLPLLKPHTTPLILNIDAALIHPPSLSIMAPSSPIKPNNSTHQILEHFSDSHINCLFGTNIDKLMPQQTCLEAYFGVVPFAVLGMRQALDPTSPNIQIWVDAHVLFVEMHKLKLKWKCGSKRLIFDPGGKMKLSNCFRQLMTLRTRSVSGRR